MYVIDRIEEDIAVIIDESKIPLDIPLDSIEGEVREGVVLLKNEDSWIVDEEATSDRLSNIRKRLDRLFGN